MLAATALSQPCRLVPYGPNTDDPVSIKAQIGVDAQRAKTGRQSRRPQAQLLHFTITWTCRMRAAEFAAARAAALAAQDEPILAPYWPAACKVADTPPLTGSLTVAWSDKWATWAINPVSFSGYTYYAPLIMGRFEQPPRLASQNSDFVLAEFSIREDSPGAAALILPSESDVTFPTPDGHQCAIFPFAPDPSEEPSPALPSVDVERQPLGPGRQQSTTFHPQLPEQGLQATYKLSSSAAAARLIAWWQRRAGGADPCWVATTQSLGRLTRNFALAESLLPITAPVLTSAGETLALLTTGQPPEFVRVSEVHDGYLTLSAPVAAAHSSAWTVIVPAILARHTDEELAIDYSRANEGWIAVATLAFREVAPEYSVTDGETRGTTIGRLLAPAWLFRVDLDYCGAIQSWFLTNWESGATTPDDQVWEYRDCDFDKLTQSMDLEDDSCTFKFRWWAGCPWENWLPGKLAATGTLTILRADVSASGTVGTPVVRWQGELSTPTREGPIYAVKVLGANTQFSRRAPRQLLIPPCGTTLFSTRCGLLLINWSFTAQISAVGAHTLTIAGITRANGAALPSGIGSLDFFVPGYAAWTDGSNHPIRSEIIACSAFDDIGQVVLTLGRLLGCSVGAGITVVMGCDLQAGTCSQRFNNHNRFRGSDFMPAVSPNFIVPQKSATPAKK
jgi:hypothetical protein